MAECIHEIEEATCGVCTPRKRPLPPSGGFGPWFPASFDGDCDGPCTGEIKAGDVIRSDGEGGWLCGDCGRDEAPRGGTALWPGG